MWLFNGGPRRYPVHDQSVENAQEQVEDTVSELCGQSTHANVKKYRFCGQEIVGAAKIAKAPGT
jgi:hypothetical protein